MILTVGAIAAGGACVARGEDGRVVFVRHCLPGETVRVDAEETAPDVTVMLSRTADAPDYKLSARSRIEGTRFSSRMKNM